jgi:serine/threonine protein kinase
LKKLKHDNIVKYIDCIETDGYLNIILEYIESNLFNYIYRRLACLHYQEVRAIPRTTGCYLYQAGLDRLRLLARLRCRSQGYQGSQYPHNQGWHCQTSGFWSRHQAHRR